jgi:hypothetical protein
MIDLTLLGICAGIIIVAAITIFICRFLRNMRNDAEEMCINILSRNFDAMSEMSATVYAEETIVNVEESEIERVTVFVETQYHDIFELHIDEFTVQDILYHLCNRHGIDDIVTSVLKKDDNISIKSMIGSYITKLSPEALLAPSYMIRNGAYADNWTLIEVDESGELSFEFSAKDGYPYTEVKTILNKRRDDYTYTEANGQLIIEDSDGFVCVLTNAQMSVNVSTKLGAVRKNI